MRIHIKKYYYLLVLFSITLFNSCQSELWTEHYTIDPEVSSRISLWEAIKTNPELKKFAWAVKKTGYDKELSTEQIFTVWAPVDSSLDNIDTTATIDLKILENQYVKNHISKYSYRFSASGKERILFRDNKVSSFEKVGEDYFIGTNKLFTNSSNYCASNGILHIIQDKIPFHYNIWELLDSDERFDSLSNYLHKFDKIYFDERNSTPGDINSKGETVYLDSILYNYNTKFQKLGSLSNEDSTYKALFLTNTAWSAAYEQIKSYYRYYASSSSASDKYTADTLQRNNTMNSLTGDLFFRKAIANDTLISTRGNKIYNPFAGAEEKIASNGTAYISDYFNYNPWDSWNNNIVVEAERGTGRAYDPSFASVIDRTYSGSDTIAISKNRYTQVSPVYTSINQYITFDIPNTLSGKLNPDSTLMYGAAYNIYCVFAPNILMTDNPKPGKVSFTFYYRTEAGTVLSKSISTKVISANQVSKVLIVSKMAFPYSEYGFVTPNVKLKVSNVATSKESATYTRDMLIDAIILEPIRK